MTNTKQAFLDLKEMLEMKFPNATIENPQYRRTGDIDHNCHEWTMMMTNKDRRTEFRIEHTTMDWNTSYYEFIVGQTKGVTISTYKRTPITVWDITGHGMMELLQSKYGMK